MASELGRCARSLGWAAAAALMLAGALPAAAADPENKPRIYRCDVDGKKVTRDRPIAECSDREQRLLNADGSVNRDHPADADRRRARREEAAADREAEVERVARQTTRSGATAT